MGQMIRIQLDGVQVAIPAKQEIFPDNVKVRYVFVKDSETGQQVRVVAGSKTMREYAVMILESGHTPWVLAACEVCEGEACVTYKDLTGRVLTKPCVHCYGSGLTGIKEAA